MPEVSRVSLTDYAALSAFLADFPDDESGSADSWLRRMRTWWDLNPGLRRRDCTRGWLLREQGRDRRLPRRDSLEIPAGRARDDGVRRDDLARAAGIPGHEHRPEAPADGRARGRAALLDDAARRSRAPAEAARLRADAQRRRRRNAQRHHPRLREAVAGQAQWQGLGPGSREAAPRRPLDAFQASAHAAACGAARTRRSARFTRPTKRSTTSGSGRGTDTRARMSALRTAINWYCFSSPDFEKTLLGYFDGDRLAGYIVFLSVERRGMRFFECVDLWIEPGPRREVVLGALVEKARRFAEESLIRPHVPAALRPHDRGNLWPAGIAADARPAQARVLHGPERTHAPVDARELVPRPGGRRLRPLTPSRPA